MPDKRQFQCVVIEGNGSRPSHHGDGCKESDTMFTLNTIDRHGVSYAVDMGGGKGSCVVDEGKSPTLCTTHYGEPVVCYPKTIGSLMASGYQKNGTQEAMNDMYVVLETYHCTSEVDGVTHPLKARDYKDPLVIAIEQKERW